MSTQLPHEKGFHISWDQIHRDSRALAWRLDRRGPGEDGAWKAVVAITRGGMAPAIISLALGRSVRIWRKAVTSRPTPLYGRT